MTSTTAGPTVEIVKLPDFSTEGVRALLEVAEHAKRLGQLPAANLVFAALLEWGGDAIAVGWEADYSGDPYYDLAVLRDPEGEAPELCIPAPLLITTVALRLYQTAVAAGTVVEREVHARADHEASPAEVGDLRDRLLSDLEDAPVLEGARVNLMQVIDCLIPPTTAAVRQWLTD